MDKLDDPTTEAERLFEVYLLRKIKRSMDDENLTLDQILAVLERARNIVTEIKLECVALEMGKKNEE